MQIDSMLSATTARLYIVSANTPFIDAARLLGAGMLRILTVCAEDGRAVGVVTRTDALRHLGKHPEARGITVEHLMTSLIVSARPEDDLLATWQMMAGKGLNHLPVLDHHGRPLGVLTLDDALKVLLLSERYEERLLADYVAGIGYR